MKKVAKLNWIISTLAVFILLLPLYTGADGGLLEKLQFDAQGNAFYSRFNFTDIKEPYDGVDGWAELKFSYWIDDKESMSPYVSFIPSSTTEEEFWWQKNVQIVAGFQWYPVVTLFPEQQISIGGKFHHLRAIRLYAFYAWRDYYDEPDDADPEASDFQIGADFYYDNLESQFDDKKYITVSWTNAGFRETNFSTKDYNAFLWTGNIKVGPRFKPSNSVLFPYCVIDWTYVPKYKERWWENFLRIGGGIRWYPWFHKEIANRRYIGGILKRFHIFGEVLHNAAWLGDSPENDIEETDYRIGLGFSTGGFLKD